MFCMMFDVFLLYSDYNGSIIEEENRYYELKQEKH